MRSEIKLLLAFCFTFLGAIAIGTYQFLDPRSAHFVLSGGDIITMDKERPSASHVAVHGERILAVGDRQDVMPHQRWFTRQIDLNGQTLLPGMIEPHSHPIAAAVLSQWLDVSGFTYPKSEDVYEALIKEVAATPKGQAIFAFGLDAILTPDLVLPNRDLLDEIAPDNPVLILSQIMHTAWFNTAAMRAAGVDDTVQDPKGGHFERFDDGRLNGVVHEEAMKLLLVNSEANWWDKIQQALSVRQAFIDQYGDYSKAGLTSITALGAVPMFDGYFGFLEHIATRRGAPVRTFMAPLSTEVDKTHYTPDYRNGKFRVAGVKFHLDGSPWTGGMATAEPYLENEFTLDTLKMPRDNLGILKYSDDEFIAQFAEYHDQGWQIAVHSHGERAHSLVLDAIERAQARNPRSDARHRMEHLGLFTREDMQRANRLGVTPSFFVDHIYYFGPTIRDRLLGAERADRFMPLAWANQEFEQVSLHMDTPATPIEPWRMLKTATTRIPRFANTPLNTAQLMTRQNALEALTIDAAYQLHADHEIGSIEVGKYADFTLLNKNPLSTPAQAWDQIRSTGTWLAGQAVLH